MYRYLVGDAYLSVLALVGPVRLYPVAHLDLG